MNIGTLEIQMMADMAQLKSDMFTAKSAVGEAMAQITEYVGYAKTALGVFAGAATLDQFAGIIKGAIDSAAAFTDLATKTGASVESLSAFAAVGKMTGTTADDIAGMMNKLAKNMAVANEDSKGAGQAIAALGLNFNELKAMSPNEKLVALAESMNDFADGSGKSAAAMTLLGKSGADALPFLKDLAETQNLQAKFTEEQSAQAKAFDLELKRIQVSGDAWKKELAMGMLPALQEAAGATLGVINQTGGLREQIKALAADGSIADWTRTVITGATYVMDIFSGLKAVFFSVVESIVYMASSAVLQVGGVATILNKIIHGDFSEAANAIKTTTLAQQMMTEDFHTTLDKTWGEETLGRQLRARMADMKGVAVAVGETKPELDFAAEAAAALAAEHANGQKAAWAFTDSIILLSDQIDAERSSHEKLSPAQKKNIELTDDIASGKIIMGSALEQADRALIAHMIQTEKANTLYTEEKKLQAEIEKDREADIATLYKHTDAMQAENEKLIEQIYQSAMGDEAYKRLVISRLLDEATQKEQTAATSDQSAELLKQAQILRDRASILETGLVLKEAQASAAEWKKTSDSIGQGLTNAFLGAVESGKSIFVAFRDYLIKMFESMVLSPTIQMMMSPVSNALTGMVNGALGVTGAGTGTSAAGGSGALGTLGAVGSSISAATGLSGGTGVMGSIGTALGLNTTGAGAASAVSSAGSLASAGGGDIMAGLASQTSAASMQASFAAADLASAGSLAAGAIATGGVETGMTMASAAAMDAGYSALAVEGGGLMAGEGLLAALGPVGWAVGGALLIASLAGGQSHSFGELGWVDSHFKADGSLANNTLSGSGSTGDGTAINKMIEAQYLSLVGGPANAQPHEFKYHEWLDNTDKTHNVSLWADGIMSGSVNMAKLSDVESLMKSTAQAAAAFDAAPAYDANANDRSMINGFANGGDFGGGVRLVGEHGPEIEVTGPSRIFNADQTASMLRSGGANGSELLDELRLLREEVRGLRASTERVNQNTQSTADSLRGRQSTPLLVQVVTS